MYHQALSATLPSSPPKPFSSSITGTHQLPAVAVSAGSAATAAVSATAAAGLTAVSVTAVSAGTEGAASFFPRRRTVGAGNLALYRRGRQTTLVVAGTVLQIAFQLIVFLRDTQTLGEDGRPLEKDNRHFEDGIVHALLAGTGLQLARRLYAVRFVDIESSGSRTVIAYPCRIDVPARIGLSLKHHIYFRRTDSFVGHRETYLRRQRCKAQEHQCHESKKSSHIFVQMNSEITFSRQKYIFLPERHPPVPDFPVVCGVFPST